MFEYWHFRVIFFALFNFRMYSNFLRLKMCKILYGKAGIRMESYFIFLEGWMRLIRAYIWKYDPVIRFTSLVSLKFRETNFIPEKLKEEFLLYIVTKTLSLSKKKDSEKHLFLDLGPNMSHSLTDLPLLALSEQYLFLTVLI